MAPAVDVDLILSRFPGPVTLYRSRSKWWLVLLACAAFVAIGYGMISTHASGGWLVLVFFSIGAIVAAISLLPGMGSLTLDGTGFTIVVLFRRRQQLRWQDAKDFESVVIPFTTQKTVAFDVRSLAGRALAKLSVVISGHDGALPDTYGLSADDLARLMAQWREQAIATHSADVG